MREDTKSARVCCPQEAQDCSGVGESKFSPSDLCPSTSNAEIRDARFWYRQEEAQDHSFVNQFNSQELLGSAISVHSPPKLDLEAPSTDCTKDTSQKLPIQIVGFIKLLEEVQ